MKYVIAILGFVALVVIFCVLSAYPTMWFVNYLIAPSILTALFGIAQLTVWKALALNFVIALFKCSAVIQKEK